MKGHNHAFPGVRCPVCRRIEVMCLAAVAAWLLLVLGTIAYLVLR